MSAPAVVQAALGKVCVFWLASGCYAIEATLVGEIADIDAVTALPRCPAAILGLANLRGRALAVIDLEQVLGIDAPSPQRAAARVLVLRLPGLSAGAPIQRVEGILARAPDGLRAANRAAEPDHVAGFLAFAERPGLVATLIAPAALARRLDALRFQRAVRRPAPSN
jgi:chemotaxis signal transduction protein